MQLCDVFLELGEDRFSHLVSSISIGRLKTFQLYERFKTRSHLPKLNVETLRKAAPRLWARLKDHNDDFATDLAQAVLVSHLDMIVEVLNFVGIPHEDGFFAKDLDAKPHLTEGGRRGSSRIPREVFRAVAAVLYQSSLVGVARR